MVVRERRRISSLARTASSLDEKLQQAEKVAEESEAKLRSHMDEHKYMVAELAQNQQKNILSLMEMVKSDRLEGIEGHTTDDLSHSDEAKLLVLANERIAVLESQVQQYELESNEAKSSLESSEVVIELRQAYEQACSTRNKVESELEKTIDVLQEVQEHLSNANSNRDPDLLPYTLGLVDNAISRLQNDKESGRNTSFNRSQESRSSPFVLHHMEGDSPNMDGEPPDDLDWEKELMEDLEFIAEGKIPPSLQNLPGFAEQVATLDSMATEQESGSVFDRLTNPAYFTGTQKRKARKSKKVRITSSARPRNDQAGQASTAEITTKLRVAEGDLTPDALSTPVNSAQTGERAVQPTTSKKMYKSVFDRLISPSQATGTQREKLARKSESSDDDMGLDDTEGGAGNEAFDRLLEEALGDPATLKEPREKGSNSHDETEEQGSFSGVSQSQSDPTDGPVSTELRTHGRNYTEYAEQDVFERLQRTSTVSYQNRQGAHVMEGSTRPYHPTKDAHNHDDTGATLNTLETPFQTHTHKEHHDDDYTSQNVFERLQKRSTEAYAKKVNKPKDAM